MRQRIGLFMRDAAGLEVVEYAVIGGLIAFGLVVTLAAVGGWVQGVYATLATGVGA